MTVQASRSRGSTALFLYALLYVAFLYAPVVLLPIFSFNNSVFIAFPLSGFTTRWYSEMAADRAMHAALWNTLTVGAVASLGSTVLGLLAAKALTQGRVPGRSAVLAVTNLSLFIPEIVLGIALLLLVTTVGVPLSLVSVTIGHLLICLRQEPDVVRLESRAQSLIGSAAADDTIHLLDICGDRSSRERTACRVVVELRVGPLIQVHTRSLCARDGNVSSSHTAHRKRARRGKFAVCKAMTEIHAANGRGATQKVVAHIVELPVHTGEDEADSAFSLSEIM